MLLANSALHWGQQSKTRFWGLRPWYFPKPIHNTHQIYSCRRRDMLEMRFGEASIPRATHTQRMDGLGDGPFDAGAHGIAGQKIVRSLALARRLQGLVLALWQNGQEA